MVVPALPEFAERYGFSAAVAALIFAAFPVGQLVAALVAAGLVERIGRRPVMMAAPLVLSLATLAFALAERARAARRRALRAGRRRRAGVDRRPRGDRGRLPSDQLGFRMGLAETAGGAIGLLGPVLGGALIDAVGTTATFALAAILPAARGGARRSSSPRPARGRAEALPLLPALRRLVVNAPGAGGVRCRSRGVAAVLALLEPLLPLDLDERLGLSSLAIGLVFAAGLLAYFAVVPLGGPLVGPARPPRSRRSSAAC